MSEWWAYYVASLKDTLVAIVIGIGAATVLLLGLRWLFRAGGPFNK